MLVSSAVIVILRHAELVLMEVCKAGSDCLFCFVCGLMRTVVQVETGHDRNVTLGGRIAYALWRSVYAVKQVDARSRVCLSRLLKLSLFTRERNGLILFLTVLLSTQILVLFDYFKSRVFGRDISQF